MLAVLVLAIGVVGLLRGPSDTNTPPSAVGVSGVPLGPATVSQVSAAVRLCAAKTPDGSFATCDARGVAVYAPPLGPLLDACGSPGGACITVDAADSFTVTVTDDGSPTTTYTQTKDAGGTATRTCDGPACPSGTWAAG